MIRFVLAALACGLPLYAQAGVHTVGAPALGFVPGKDGASVQAVLGIPGAARFGSTLSLASVHAVFVAPGSNYVLAAQDNGEMSVGLLRPASAVADGIALMPIAGASGADVVAFSPTGYTAAIYAKASGSVQVLTGLPALPKVARTVAVAGVLTRLAVSDSAAQLVGATEDGHVVSLPDGAELSAEANGAFAFAPNADTVKPLTGGSGDAVITVDGSTALSLGKDGTSVIAQDLRSGRVSRLALTDKLVSLRRFSAGDIYVLNFDNGSSGLLTWRAGKLTTYFIGVSGNTAGGSN